MSQFTLMEVRAGTKAETKAECGFLGACSANFLI